MTGRTQTPFIPGGFSKTVEVGTTALATDASNIVTEAVGAVATAAAGAVTRALINRALDVATQTHEEVPIITVSTDSQTEQVGPVVVESPLLLARLASVEEANASTALELTKARATIARLELEAQSLNFKRELLERAASEADQKITNGQEIIDALTSRYASGRATIGLLQKNLQTATETLRELGAHSKATIMNLFNLLTEKSETKASAHKASIKSSVEATLEEVAALIGRA